MNYMFFMSFCLKKTEGKYVLYVFLSKKRMNNNLFFLSSKQSSVYLSSVLLS